MTGAPDMARKDTQGHVVICDTPTDIPVGLSLCLGWHVHIVSTNQLYIVANSGSLLKCDNFSYNDLTDTPAIPIYPVSIAQGGTGSTTAAGARANLVAAATSASLSQFAATTSAQLAGVISDETGSGALVFGTSPTLVTPLLGTPTSGTLTGTMEPWRMTIGRLWAK